MATIALGPVGAALCNAPLLGHFCATLPVALTKPAVPESSNQRAGGAPDYLHLISLQQKFEEILDSSSDAGLAFSIQFSEVALRDLASVVAHSQLPDKMSLSTQINAFVTACKGATSSLRKLESRVGGAIDKCVVSLFCAGNVLTAAFSSFFSSGSILAVNEYALGTLNTISLIPSTPRVFALTASQLSDTSVVRRTEREALVIDFNRACHAMQIELKDLIAEAEASVEVLDGLDAHLVTIFETVLTTGALVTSSEANVVSYFLNHAPPGTHVPLPF